MPKNGNGFWQIATDAEKFERMKNDFNRIVIKQDGCWGWKRVLLNNGYE